MVTAGTLALTSGGEQPPYFATEEASHTPAFDEWTNPFSFDTSVNGEMVGVRLLKKAEILEPLSLGGRACLVLRTRRVCTKRGCRRS